MNMEIKKLNDKAIIPTYGTKCAAGFDFYACIDNDLTINPGETSFIGTGISMAIPDNYAGLIYPRSSWGAKRGLALPNCVGVIDSDYRGEIIIPLFNHSNIPQTINPFDRIAQMIITPYQKVNFVETDKLDETERGNRGFGSTGTK